ncbi:bifunctional 2-polyprenyl-6-hydroxyphenol methylase/3-demethylubiquinol 3-O-methyltransferase UbiG [Vibrio sp. EJY3]|uniref:class I SAM-dependent methyltransferase n=1 Tax=Vibrio sp. (strain EJY3) TaxID=1116375 RepID=UPI000243C0B5|nr:class I SAM-dependent methyltransferase [Vibrio sp. EJY3]AEX21756.1 methyltransferase [Vibrio sp. EJY3]
MKQNKYDDPAFFEAYAKMPRSTDGLKSAGEWEVFRSNLPELSGKKVLDLGCGYGWHCQYAVGQGAEAVVGIDLSEKMLEKARELTDKGNVTFERCAIEDFDAEDESFDVIFSSLALHYVADLRSVFHRAFKLLKPKGVICYSVEHPIFTSNSSQDWYYEKSKIQHWPLDNYFHEGERKTEFLGSEVIKYHRTIETHISTLLSEGFEIRSVLEPKPSDEMVEKMGWQDELRRPMMLIITAVKK